MFAVVTVSHYAIFGFFPAPARHNAGASFKGGMPTAS